MKNDDNKNDDNSTTNINMLRITKIITATKNKLVMQKVLARIPAVDREEFLNFCVRQYSRIVNNRRVRNNRKNKTRFSEVIYLVATLYESKALNIYFRYSLSSCIHGVDKHGFITSLDLDITMFDCELLELNHDDVDEEWSMYVMDISECNSIGRFAKLETLTIRHGGGRLPNTLTNLKYLKHLEFHFFPNLSHFAQQSSSVNLSCVEQILIYNCQFRSSPPSAFCEWMGTNLPKLTHLRFETDSREQTAIIDTLCNLEEYGNGARLYTNLKKIDFYDDFDPASREVQKFLRDAVPKFSFLEAIYCYCHEVKLHALASLTLPPSIHIFGVYGALLFQRAQLTTEDAKSNQVNATVTFLKKNNNVISLGYHKYHPKIAHALLQNLIGQYYFQQSRRRRRCSQNTTNSINTNMPKTGSDNNQQHHVHNAEDDANIAESKNDGSISIPQSILPFYFDRAHQKRINRIYAGCGYQLPPHERENDPTIMYYLLQEFVSHIFVANAVDVDVDGDVEHDHGKNRLTTNRRQTTTRKRRRQSLR